MLVSRQSRTKLLAAENPTYPPVGWTLSEKKLDSRDSVSRANAIHVTPR